MASVKKDAAEVPEDPLVRIGTTGLKQFGGYIREEFFQDLKGKNGARVYREMRDNNDVVGAVMHAIETLIRAVAWTVEPADTENTDDADAAEFIQDNLDNIKPGWQDTLSDILSFLTFGWSLHEILYKRRDDGRLGWDGFPIRAQESLLKWEWDEDLDKAVGMWQQPETRSGVLLIPFNKALHFRTSAHKNNPEGRSVLRNAYVPFYRKKHIESIEAIGVERDLAGYPVMYVPKDWTNPDAAVAQKTLYEDAKTFVRNLRRDEQEGVVFPSIYDSENNQILRIELLSTEGRRQIDTGAIVKRYSASIAATLLADFILLGHENVGSFALSSDKTELFEYSLTGWLASIAEQFNCNAIPDLLTLNGMTGRCMLAHGNIEKPDLRAMAEFIERMTLSGVIVPDDMLQQHVRDVAGLPKTQGLMDPE